MSVYLQPNGPVAKRALLPGDPKRAMELANLLLEKPLMSNLSRGLWGYHGATSAGEKLTVQATGIGAPSATIVRHEMAALGLDRAIRVGTCVALEGGPPPGTFVLGAKALESTGPRAADGADVSLTAALKALLGGDTPSLAVAPMERYYDAAAVARRATWTEAGATIADLCTGALLEAGAELGVGVASALVVAEDAAGKRLPDERLESRLMELGQIAAEALIASGEESPASAS
ncbi:purine-nucleoside phosphorylase [soil metagenome]